MLVVSCRDLMEFLDKFSARRQTHVSLKPTIFLPLRLLRFLYFTEHHMVIYSTCVNIICFQWIFDALLCLILCWASLQERITDLYFLSRSLNWREFVLGGPLTFVFGLDAVDGLLVVRGIGISCKHISTFNDVDIARLFFIPAPNHMAAFPLYNISGFRIQALAFPIKLHLFNLFKPHSWTGLW